MYILVWLELSQASHVYSLAILSGLRGPSLRGLEVVTVNLSLMYICTYHSVVVRNYVHRYLRYARYVLHRYSGLFQI